MTGLEFRRLAMNNLLSSLEKLLKEQALKDEGVGSEGEERLLYAGVSYGSCQLTAPPDDLLIDKQRAVALRELLSRMTPRESHALRRKFGVDSGEMTLKQLSSRLRSKRGQFYRRVSENRVRQIQERALRRLQVWSNFKKLAHLFEALLVLFFALGCSAPPDDEATCDPRGGHFSPSAMEVVCQAQGVNCDFVASVDLAVALIGPRRVLISVPLCEQNAALCWFALWHELGHLKQETRDEDAADCYAAQHAEPSDVDAAVCYFASTVEVGSDGSHRTGVDRAEWIRGCR